MKKKRKFLSKKMSAHATRKEKIAVRNNHKTQLLMNKTTLSYRKKKRLTNLNYYT